MRRAQWRGPVKTKTGQQPETSPTGASDVWELLTLGAPADEDVRLHVYVRLQAALAAARARMTGRGCLTRLGAQYFGLDYQGRRASS
jgi:hypothetical protein